MSEKKCKIIEVIGSRSYTFTPKDGPDQGKEISLKEWKLRVAPEGEKTENADGEQVQKRVRVKCSTKTDGVFEEGQEQDFEFTGQVKEDEDQVRWEKVKKARKGGAYGGGRGGGGGGPRNGHPVGPLLSTGKYAAFAAAMQISIYNKMMAHAAEGLTNPCNGETAVIEPADVWREAGLWARSGAIDANIGVKLPDSSD